MTPRRTLAATIAAGALLFAACGDDDDTSADQPDATETTAPEDAAPEAVALDGPLEIVDFEFLPPDFTVAAGTVVAVTNADGTPHTATARNGEFNTDSIDGGGAEGSLTAPDEAGTYEYFCSFHPFMTGTLTVE